MDSLDLVTVYARNCSVKAIPRAVAEPFLEANHRMGYCKSRYRFGLFVERSTGAGESSFPPGTLVAVASFSNPRNMTEKGGSARSFEWLRYASLEGVRVVGGMSKLLRTFVDAKHPDDVMTYVDASESVGDAYVALGFENEGLCGGSGYKNYKYRKKFLYLDNQTVSK